MLDKNLLEVALFIDKLEFAEDVCNSLAALIEKNNERGAENEKR